jgi:tetratricopeptide (TPR) repeat protein
MFATEHRVRNGVADVSNPMLHRRAAALFCSIAALFLLPGLRAQTETMPERTLKQLLERQKLLFDEAAKEGDKMDTESLRVQLQEICHGYEILLHDSPKFAVAYADYGYLLRKVDMQQEAAAMFLKANAIDPNIAFVKNELGNYLAEQGKPLEAVNYFIAAIKLAPNEPLYHYQLGTLLHEAADDFLGKGVYTRKQLDDAMHNAFKKAMELAPDRIEFTYRYAESFNDLEKPDLDEALKVWASLEERAQTPMERGTMRLQAANVLIRQAKFDHARLLLSMVTEPGLEGQKQKLVAQLPENAKK